MKKDVVIYSILIFLVIVIISLILFYKGSDNNQINKELAECIGKNSELYVQIGCSACKAQEEIFGENYKYLTTTDCYYERDICIEKQITATPTWIIKEEYHKGLKNIEELKELTGC